MSVTSRKWWPRFLKTRSRDRTPSLPHNSSLPEVEGLRKLRTHPAWEHLQALLERVAQQEYDQLAQGLPHDQYLAQVGAYQCARRYVDLVDTLIEKADEYYGRTRDTTEHDRAHRGAIFYASPYGQVDRRATQ